MHSKNNRRESVLYTPSALALVRMVTNDVYDEMPGPPLETGETSEKSLSDLLVDEVLDFTAMHTLAGEESGVNGVEKHHEVSDNDACMHVY